MVRTKIICFLVMGRKHIKSLTIFDFDTDRNRVVTEDSEMPDFHMISTYDARVYYRGNRDSILLIELTQGIKNLT